MKLSLTQSLLTESNARFESIERIEFRRIPGFQKSHRVPRKHTPAAEKFLGSLVSPLLEAEFQKFHTFFRKTFGLKRTEMDVHLDPVGLGVLETPWFRIEKEYKMDPADTGQVAVRLVMDRIRQFGRLSEFEFPADLHVAFQVLAFDLDREIDIESLIDSLEEMESLPAGLELEYDFRATSCMLRWPDPDAGLEIRPKTMAFRSQSRMSPRDILRHLAEFEQLVSGFQFR